MNGNGKGWEPKFQNKIVSDKFKVKEKLKSRKFDDEPKSNILKIYFNVKKSKMEFGTADKLQICP
jgi:hypothetical protein